MKKQHNALTLANLELDRRLFNELKSLGIIQTQSELGKMCGKNTSYFACMRNKGFGLQIGSLAFLNSRFFQMLKTEVDEQKRMKIQQAMKAVGDTVNEKCRLREIELHAY